MFCKCPKCSKTIEINTKDKKAVICPQCLHEFFPKNKDIKYREDSTIENNQFSCVNCGKLLPYSDFKYCPYCRSTLNVQSTIKSKHVKSENEKDLITNVNEIFKDNNTTYLEKTAREGDAEAQFNLGLCYYIGEGFTKDVKTSILLVAKSG